LGTVFKKDFWKGGGDHKYDAKPDGERGNLFKGLVLPEIIRRKKPNEGGRGKRKKILRGDKRSWEEKEHRVQWNGLTKKAYWTTSLYKRQQKKKKKKN